MGIFQILEVISMLTGIACVFFQTQEKIIAWPFGIVSVTLAVFVFRNEMLYSDFILHIIYIALNAYGWWFWSQRLKSSDSSVQEQAPIRAMNLQFFSYWALFILLFAWVWGTYMDQLFEASFPYFDAFTTVGSLAAQYLLAKKIIQNWLIWIVVDVVAIGIYMAKGLYFFSFLFFVYLILCIYGYINWRKALIDGTAHIE